MEKKYQVFISSTYSDLIEERKKVLDVLLMADCIPAGMEAFVATDTEQFEVIKKVIDLCDYYVLIIGKRYGSINENTGISYTEMEYDYAISQDIPVLVFALDDSVDVSDDKTENDPLKIEKLKKFRVKALTNRLASIWHTDTELTGQLAIAIMKAKDQISRPGWQRGADYDEASLRREIMQLQKENNELHETIEQKEKALAAFTEQSDLAFENQPIIIDYKHSYFDGQRNKSSNEQLETDLVNIFRIIATEMMDVAISEEAIHTALLKGLKLSTYSDSIKDEQFIKRMLNQFKALSLIKSSWSSEKNVLFWHLTKKGTKIRDDLILLRQKAD